MVPLSVGTFYNVLISIFFGNSINILSLESILNIYCFGFMAVALFSNLILSDVIDSVLLLLGYIPIFENLSFAIITTWNAIIHNNYEINEEDNNAANNHKTKVLNDIKTLKILISFKTIDDLHLKIGTLIAFIFFEDYLGSLFQLKFPIKIYRGYLLGIFSSILLKVFYVPMTQWMKLYYKSIKDENYLIGMELQNSVEVKFIYFNLFY